MLSDKLLELVTKHFRPVMYLIVAGVMIALVHLLLENFASRWPLVMLATAAFVLLVAGTFMLVTLLERVDALGPQAPSFKYYDVFGRQGRSVLFAEAKKIIASAQREILILNWSAEEEFERDVQESRADYYDKLVERSRQLTYTRVIQSDSYWPEAKAPSIGETFEESYVEHFAAMLAARKEQRECGRYTTELLVVPPSIPSTFLIADDEHLIWQLNQVRDPTPGEAKHWQIRGAIVVYDPEGSIIQHFKEEFTRAKSHHRTLEESDLTRKRS